MAANTTQLAQKEESFFPISDLSTYQRGWTIGARVTQKGQLRTYNKNGRAGKVFSVELADEHSDIRATFFDDAVDQFYDKLQLGKCFSFSRGGTKIANRQFTNCKHRYELTFDKLSEIKELADIASIEAVRLNITPLKAVQSKELPCTVDICGVLTAVTQAFSFTSQAGQPLVKRELTLADDSAVSLTVTIWGDKAQQDDRHFEGNPIVALKGVSVKEWQGGRSGSLISVGALQFRPTIPEAKRVQQWWEQGGSTQSLSQLSVQRDTSGASRAALNAKATNLAAMRRASDVVGTQPEFFTVVTRLAFVQTRKRDETQPLVYMACQEPKEGNNFPCNRRVDAQGFCASCNRVGRAGPRYNLRAKFSDFSDSAWITTFHEGGKGVLGFSAEKARELDMGDNAVRETALRERYFAEPLQVTVRIKLGSYNNEPRNETVCIDARPVSRREVGRAMLKEIYELMPVLA